LQELTTDLLIAINKSIGEKGTVVNPGNLSYLVEAAAAVKEPIFAAASLLFDIITLHPFLDGNKRTAVVTAESYLSVFDIKTNISDDEFEKIVYEIAIGKHTKRGIAKILKDKSGIK
jgi:death-on-curing family protein